MRRVVITGMGVISPIGNSVDAFADSLFKGIHGFAEIDRFDTEQLPVKYAGIVKDFDPRAYMPGPEARRMDLYSQYAMAASIQAMDMAGLSGHIDPERLGVYMGSGIGGMLTFYSESVKLHEGGPRRVSPFFIPMMIGNMAAGLIAIRFDARGPVLPVVSACATGTHEIGEAYRAIAHGHADAIIAGGAEACVTPLAIAGFANMKALTTHEDLNSASVPFDAARSGFVIGEGAGALVIEAEEHALARGANILAYVTGYGNTCDAHHMTAPAPEGRGVAEAIRLALRTADHVPREQMHINAHGTSTPPNDLIESQAINAVFGEEAMKPYVTSTKSMTGHMLGAAGAVEAVACVLALREGMIPPTVGTKELDPACAVNVVLGSARRADIRQALSTSLGFGGHNACICLEKA